jgi:DNA polymerase-3 subunit gamma/tau
MMDYQISARKYRPASFEDVIGQPHVVQTLTNAIGSKRIAQAFLFSGTRGVGKTTMARILAKALNCERGPTATPCGTCPNCTEIAQGTSVDVIEIDGASNTSVDDVRELRENVKFAPFRGSYRIYIIDEVHMLSNSAFNALLKTLEEPPPHVVFVFATTEIHKIPATILSRCQHYNFRRIPKTEIMQRLRHVAEHGGISVEDRSLASIARAAQGSMRDALSLLDQAIAYGGTPVRHSDLELLLGAIPQEHVRTMVAAILSQDSPTSVRTIAHLLDQGHDLRAYCAELVEYLRHLLVASVVPASQELRGLIDLSDDELRQIAEDAKAFTPEQLQELFRIFCQAEDELRLSAHPRFVLEVAAIRATRLLHEATTAPVAAAPTVRPSDVKPKPAATSVQAPPPKPMPPRSIANQATASSQPPPVQSARAAPSRPTPDRTPASGPMPEPEPPMTLKMSLNWEQVLDRVEAQQPNLAPFLSVGKPVSMQQGEVKLAYPPTASVARAMVEKPENLKFISGVCAELAGGPIRLILVELTEELTAGPSMGEMRAARERGQKEALLERTRSHPLVKQTLEIFGGQLTAVREQSPDKERSS